jgi:hypothetical protein
MKNGDVVWWRVVVNAWLREAFALPHRAPPAVAVVRLGVVLVSRATADRRPAARAAVRDEQGRLPQGPGCVFGAAPSAALVVIGRSLSKGDPIVYTAAGRERGGGSVEEAGDGAEHGCTPFEEALPCTSPGVVPVALVGRGSEGGCVTPVRRARSRCCRAVCRAAPRAVRC